MQLQKKRGLLFDKRDPLRDKRGPRIPAAKLEFCGNFPPRNPQAPAVVQRGSHLMKRDPLHVKIDPSDVKRDLLLIVGLF
jgi:hypothetical protein